MFSGHPIVSQAKTADGKVVPIPCREHVWAAGTLRKTYPLTWKCAPNAGLWAFSRAGAGACNLIQNSTLSAYRFNAEMCLQCGNNGIGRVGIDFFTLPGRPALMCGKSDAHIGQAASVTAFTFAGPGGPVTTDRLEMYVEGVQSREAISFLLAAVDEKKLDPAMAAKCADLLTRRAERNLPFQPKNYNLERGTPYTDDWQQREDGLYALCAEAGKSLAGK
jgi:hypothetical protein